MQLSLRAMQHPSPRTTYKRDQVERAIGIVLYRRNTTGALLPVVKADLKRLIDIDRKPKAVRPDWQHDRHAFFDGPPPGRGRGIAYTAYNAFALLVGWQLLAGGVPQSSAVLLLRHVRTELEAEFHRIMSLDLTPLKNGRDVDTLAWELQDGFLVRDPAHMRFLIAAGGKAAAPDAGAWSEPTREICGSEQVLERLLSFSHFKQAAVVLELVNSAHQLAHWLDHLPVRRRGRP
jgi:hypothetical protein